MRDGGSTARVSWYALADERLLARTIRELHYEALLEPQPRSGGADGGARYAVEVGAGVRYVFAARRSAWGDLHVVPGSVERQLEGEARPRPRPRAAGFLLDAREALGLRPMVLGTLLEEVSATLVADAEQCQRLAMGAAALSQLSGVDLEQHLDGHPKLVGSRGRLGFGLDDLRAYAPEFSPELRPWWVAARGEGVLATLPPGHERAQLLLRTLGEAEYARLQLAAAAAGVDPERDVILPVHPWQWERFVQVQYAGQLDGGQLLPLGIFGEPYRPRMSIRSLSHAVRPDAPDLKLSLSIMNTSCYRGLGAAHVAQGGVLSRAVAEVVERDDVLLAAGTVVLRDLAGVHCPLLTQREAMGPYRYRELLAAVWRQSAGSRIEPGVQEVPAAALYQRDLSGDPLVRHWVERSGLGPEAWLVALLERTVVPLYHLLCAYGLGVIAHGQNVSVLLREGRPVGMLLRDFHGDVRLVDRAWPEQAGLPEAVTTADARRPPVEELVHDLYTGHFVSVMRFVAPALEDGLGIGERRVYALVMETVRRYMQAHPELAERFAAAALDRPHMERVCLNRARFRIGYGDLDTRPRPDLGPPTINPLAGSAGARTDGTR